MIVKNIQGWKWNTIDEFTDACALADLHFGYPKDNCSTTTCMTPNINVDSQGNILFYYIGFNIQMQEVLNDPSNFDINEEN